MNEFTITEMRGEGLNGDERSLFVLDGEQEVLRKLFAEKKICEANFTAICRDLLSQGFEMSAMCGKQQDPDAVVFVYKFSRFPEMNVPNL